MYQSCHLECKMQEDCNKQSYESMLPRSCYLKILQFVKMKARK